MYPFLIAAAVIAADQLVKLMIVSRVLPVETVEVIKNFFYITYVQNFGIAFGMFKNKTLFFIVSISLISIVLVYMIFLLYKKNTAITVCLSLILGGAIGNLIDRIRLGYVVDYLHFTIFPPVFNLADSCIVVGAILLSLIVVLNKDAL